MDTARILGLADQALAKDYREWAEHLIEMVFEILEARELGQNGHGVNHLCAKISVGA